MFEEPVKIVCGSFSLEGIMGWPEGRGPFGAVAVCHPHPLYGGSMHNNVVLAVCQALNQASLVTLRFNFRGVGKSGGTFGDGEAEQEDVQEALSFLTVTDGVDRNRIGLAGYSFGARVALAEAAEDDRVQALAVISLPLSDPVPPSSLEGFVKPRLFLCGDQDEFVSAQDLKEWVGMLPSPRWFVAVPGADHFWGEHEAEVAQMVTDFFVSYLAGSGHPKSGPRTA
ncbi:MAG: dienelactone hydrolase family protein [Chloroflexota bacterium]|nr:dienelactone hydrolase family protein [Chloroflexota bacterium]